MVYAEDTAMIVTMNIAASTSLAYNIFFHIESHVAESIFLHE